MSALRIMSHRAFDLPGLPGTTQAAQNGGGYPRFTTALDRDFRAMGIKMVSMANNHAGDWGPEGLLATLATVQAAGLVEAGAGASMGDARRAGVVYTPRGTVGLISTASTFNPATEAADGFGALPPRPGVSVLRVRPVVALTEQQMVLMRRLSRAWWRPNYGVRDEPGSVTVGGATFKPGADSGLTYLVDKEDHDAVIKSISDAKRANDLVAFSIHAHEVATSGSTASAAEFLPPLFHEAIDAGADIVLRSGPHVLGGVEIYKGKPIFYGLNSLFFIVGGREGGQRSPSTASSRASTTAPFPSLSSRAASPVWCGSIRSPRSSIGSRRSVARRSPRGRMRSGSSRRSRKSPSHSGPRSTSRTTSASSA